VIATGRRPILSGACLNDRAGLDVIVGNVVIGKGVDQEDWLEFGGNGPSQQWHPEFAVAAWKNVRPA
jgi:hypothetical protein